MKERSILFGTAMVRATLNGWKTQTRRVCKLAQANSLQHVVGIQDPGDTGQCPLHIFGSGWFGDEEGDVQFFCPYGKLGDRLWVRETWQHANHPLGPYQPGIPVFYRADYMDDPHGPDGALSPEGKYRTWRPSIHMPRAASRIVLEIAGVRVERLQDISEADARAEGATLHRPANYLSHGGWSHDGRYVHATARESFGALWNSINGIGSWSANPWVWAVEFRRVEP